MDFDMPCDDPISVKYKIPVVRQDGTVQYTAAVPCGRCGTCRKNKVDEWVFRIKQEQKDSVTAYFLTLTYSPENCPVTDNKFMTLAPKDLTDYWKRLRKWMHEDGVDLPPVKYYAVGEYGEENRRPHYHAIVLNATVDHIVEAWKPARGAELIGHVHVDVVNSNTIAYCVKYLDKGRTVPAHVRDDRVREFSRMSKHLGKGYLTPAMIAWHKADLSRNYVQDGAKKIALPRYYRERIYSDAELRKQAAMAEVAANEFEMERMADYFKLYPSHQVDDYLRSREFEKEGRYLRFTNKNRKL